MAYIPLTPPAEVDSWLLWNAFSDVHLSPEARHTHVGGVGFNGCATLATQTVWKCMWKYEYNKLRQNIHTEPRDHVRYRWTGCRWNWHWLTLCLALQQRLNFPDPSLKTASRDPDYRLATRSTPRLITNTKVTLPTPVPYLVPVPTWSN